MVELLQIYTYDSQEIDFRQRNDQIYCNINNFDAMHVSFHMVYFNLSTLRFRKFNLTIYWASLDG